MSSQYSHLVIVPCHSIWKGGKALGKDPSEWYLADFQIEGHDHLSFVDHLLQGKRVLESDPKALLVISGGQTKEAAGRVSEAESYYSLLLARLEDSMDPQIASIKERTVLEEFARDSFENVVFSICRFYEVSGVYPSHITVCGFEFKRRRFLDLHLEQALKYKLTNVTYIGNLPEPTAESIDKEKYYKDLYASEKAYGEVPFESDLYGCGPVLKKKRDSRNPFKRAHSYADTNVELKGLLEAMENGGSAKKITLPWAEEAN